MRVLAILLQDFAEQLRRAVDVAGGQRRLGGFEIRRDVAGRVADQPRDEGVDPRFGQRSHEAVDRLPVLEGEHGGDRLHAHLPGDLRVIVDIELDQLDRALRRAHRLFQHRRELAAGAAPRRPEIDQHRHLARGFDHVAHEVLGGGVLDEVGIAAAGAAVLENGGIYAHDSSALQPCKMGRTKPFGNRPKAALSRAGECGGNARTPR